MSTRRNTHALVWEGFVGASVVTLLLETVGPGDRGLEVVQGTWCWETLGTVVLGDLVLETVVWWTWSGRPLVREAVVWEWSRGPGVGRPWSGSGPGDLVLGDRGLGMVQRTWCWETVVREWTRRLGLGRPWCGSGPEDLVLGDRGLGVVLETWSGRGTHNSSGLTRGLWRWSQQYGFLRVKVM